MREVCWYGAQRAAALRSSEKEWSEAMIFWNFTKL